MSNLTITEKKEKQARQIIYARLRKFLDKATPDIDFIDETVVQCDVSQLLKTLFYR